MAKWQNPTAGNDQVPPVVAATNAAQGLYFGGKSGKYMGFQLNGKNAAISKIHHFFVVHGAFNTYGALLGYSEQSRGYGLLNTSATSGSVMTTFKDDSMHYLDSARGDLDWCNFQARFFLDGKSFDPRSSRIKAGWSLLEADMQAMPQQFDTIFHNYFETYQSTSAGRVYTPGGDYVSEILLFTNHLTEAERLDVERYLLDKWNLPQTEVLFANKSREVAHPPRGTGLVKVESNAEVEVSTADGETTAPFQFDGTGTVTKKGAGTLLIGGGAARPFAGSFELEEGDLLVHGGAMPPVTIRPGETWEAVSWPQNRAETVAGDAASGIRVSKTTSANNLVGKTGAGELMVAGVADGTKRITVESGVLHFTAKEREVLPMDVDIGVEEVYIPNHSFEEPFTWNDVYGRGYNWTSRNGWKNDAGGSYVQFMTSSCANYNAWSSSRYPLPDGTNALMIVMNGYGYTEITVPRAGDYEVSFFAASRYGSPRTGAAGDFGKRSTIEVRFNERCIGKLQADQAAYTKFRYRFTVSAQEAGSAKKFGFKSQRSFADNCMIIDDVHIRPVATAERVDVVKVPGGDFEQSDYYNPDGTLGDRVSSAFCRYMTSPDWELSVNASAKSPNPTNGYVAICTPATPLMYSMGYSSYFTPFYPQADGRCGSGVLGFIDNCGVAAAKNTFKLPKGRWALRGEIAWNPAAAKVPLDQGETSHGAQSAVEVKLTRGDQSVVSLGTVKTGCHLMSRCTWPTVVEVTAPEEDVRISIQQTAAGGSALLDNLEFAPVTAGEPDHNLFPNPDFERTGDLATWAYPTTNTYTSYTGRFNYSTDSWAFGLDVVDGDACYRLHNHAGLRETVDFPVPGLYRITVPAHPRPDGKNYMHKSLRASVVLGDNSELVIFDQPLPFNPSFEEVSYLFRMPEAGQRQVRIVGVPFPVDNANYNTMIDNIRLTKVEETGLEPPQVASTASIAVQSGAKLGLDYEGKVTLRGLKLGGTPVYGTVTARDYPEFLTGMGEIEIVPPGTLIYIR